MRSRTGAKNTHRKQGGVYHFNECLHFRTDLFDSKCQSDLLTPIAIKFDEYILVRASHLLAEFVETWLRWVLFSILKFVTSLVSNMSYEYVWLPLIGSTCRQRNGSEVFLS